MPESDQRVSGQHWYLTREKRCWLHGLKEAGGLLLVGIGITLFGIWIISGVKLKIT